MNMRQMCIGTGATYFGTYLKLLELKGILIEVAAWLTP